MIVDYIKSRHYKHIFAVISSFIFGMCVKEPCTTVLKALCASTEIIRKPHKIIHSSNKKTISPYRKSTAYLFTQADALFRDIETDINSFLICKTAQYIHAKKLQSRRYKPLATIYSSYVLQQHVT